MRMEGIGRVWFFLVVGLLLLASVVLSQQGEKNNKKKGGGRQCRKCVDGTFCVKTRKMQKRGFPVDCGGGGAGTGRIASLTVRGHKGQCQGLSPDMVVQASSCLWKEKCSLKKSKRKAFLLKVYEGDTLSCIDQQPDFFTVAYQCVRPNVPLLDVLGAKAAPVQTATGIIRSHQDHPWMYRTPFQAWATNNLTLIRPSPDLTVFIYTIRSLSLMFEDMLSVVGKKERGSDSQRYNGSDLVKDTATLRHVHEVTFSLQTSFQSTGGEGFVICFQWTNNNSRVTDACQGLIEPATCKKRKRRKRPKQNRRTNRDSASSGRNRKSRKQIHSKKKSSP